MNKIVSCLLILAIVLCSFSLFSCTDHVKNAENIEANIKYGMGQEEYYFLGTMDGVDGYKLWVEIVNGEPRFILLQPFWSSVMFRGNDFEIDISKNEDLNDFGDKLFLEYGEAITGVFDFDISNPLWQGGVIYLFSGEIYYVTPKGEKIAINLN